MTRSKSFILSRSFGQPSVAISAKITHLTYNKSDVLQTGLEYPKILNKRNKIDVVPNAIKTIKTHVYLSFRETLVNEWTPKAVCESCADWLTFEDLSNRDQQEWSAVVQVRVGFHQGFTFDRT